MEKNDLVISHTKEVEEERSSKRLAVSENEKFKYRIRCLEDDL
jgi:hypothetical protein